MIVVDTSAIVAILLDEPERLPFNTFIANNQPAITPAVILQEAGMIMRSRKGDQGVKDLFALLTDTKARILANVQAIEAQRDYWLARVDLDVALVGGGAIAGGGGISAAVGGGEPGGH